MKTTIDIADSLLAEAKRIAARKHTTVRALVEDGLRRVLDAEERNGEPFRLRDGSYRGKEGIRPEFDGNWDAIRDAIYEGRGA
jgi:Arc/MetJ family transcription regulator